MVWVVISGRCERTCMSGVSEFSLSVELLAAVDVSAPPVAATLRVETDKLLLTPHDGGSAMWLGILDIKVESRWVFDSRASF